VTDKNLMPAFQAFMALKDKIRWGSLNDDDVRQHMQYMDRTNSPETMVLVREQIAQEASDADKRKQRAAWDKLARKKPKPKKPKPYRGQA
jgi:hypothetical protein